MSKLARSSADVNAPTKQPETKKLSRREENQVGILVELRGTDPAHREKVYISDALIYCPLPYRRVKDKQVIESAHIANGEIEVVFTSTGRAELAYGQDSYVLDMLMSESKKIGSPEITMESVREVLELLGVPLDGREYAIFRGRVTRIEDLHMKIIRKGELAMNYRVVDAHNMILPTRQHVKRRNDQQRRLFPFVFRFSEEFYRDFIHHYTAMPFALLKAFAASPVEYSIAKFIYRRVLHARQPAFISLDDLQRERGSKDSNSRRFRAKLRKVVAKLQTANPDLKGVLWVQQDGLRILADKPVKMLPEFHKKV